MIPYAKENNLRLVLLNQRDFRGSTPFSPTELTMLYSPDQHQDFVQYRIAELGSFLEWFIKEQKVPVPTLQEGKRYGGIAVIAWSAANALAVPFLASFDTVSARIPEPVRAYLHSAVLYGEIPSLSSTSSVPHKSADPPVYVTGAQPVTQEEYYTPILDPIYSAEEKTLRFPLWVTGYYTHSSELFDNLPVATQNDLPSRKQFFSRIQSNPDEEPTPTAARIPVTTLEEIAEPEGLMRSHLPISAISASIFQDAFSKITSRSHVDGASSCSQVNIAIVLCTKSVGYCVCTGMEIQRIGLRSQVECGDRTTSDSGKLSLHIWDQMNHCVGNISQTMGYTCLRSESSLYSRTGTFRKTSQGSSRK